MQYTLNIDLAPYGELDQFALLARQDYNLGNRGGWFLNFRQSLGGLYARLFGLKRHHAEVHNWLPFERTHREREYHASSILFNMDSATECLTFALNALGYAASPDEFLSVTDEKQLRQIKPKNIYGTGSQAVEGYKTYFPQLKAYWEASQNLMEAIADQHDVSKHRSTIDRGGKHRLDPPPGFFENLGIENDPGERLRFSPMEEIILPTEPKKPLSQQHLSQSKDFVKLEELVQRFCPFVTQSGEKALLDAETNIKLNHTDFSGSSGK